MPSEAAKKYFDRGLAFFHRNEHEKAADLFKKAIFEEPDYPEALYNLASCQAVLGEEEDAFIYLDRASKLNPQCLTWAKEDSEYDNLRNDERFLRIFNSNNILGKEPDEDEDAAMMQEEAVEEEEEFGPAEMPQVGPAPVEKTTVAMPKLDDAQTKAPEIVKPQSNLPPCASCGGIVEGEMIPRYPLFISAGLILFGLFLTIIFLSFIAFIVGLPIIIYGCYMFLQNDNVWVCQVCGAKGKSAGQPKAGKKKKGIPSPQRAR